jgi:hypothetical protein
MTTNDEQSATAPKQSGEDDAAIDENANLVAAISSLTGAIAARNTEPGEVSDKVVDDNARSLENNLALNPAAVKFDTSTRQNFFRSAKR